MQNVGVRAPFIGVSLVQYPGHHLEPGSNAIDFSGIVNGWINDVKIINADSGIFIREKSRFCTIEHVTFTAATGRALDGYDTVSLHPWPVVGHHGMLAGGLSQDNLFTDTPLRAAVYP